MSTPLSEQTSAEKLEILGRKHAVSHFEKGNFIYSPNEEVQKWLDRNHVMTTQAEFDALHDAYCKGFKSYHVEKWIDGLDEKEVADLRQRLLPTVCLDESKTLEWGKRRDESEETLLSIRGETSSVPVSSPSAASGVISAPLVPNVVKVAQEGSVCEVEPLGEVITKGDNHFVEHIQVSGAMLTLDSSVRFPHQMSIFTEELPYFDRSTLPSLIAHLQAWLATGSFDLKGLPYSHVTPSLEEVVDMARKELCKVGTQDRFIPGFVSGWLRKSESSPPSSEDTELPNMAELEDWMVRLWKEVETVAGIATMFVPVREACGDMLDTFYSQRPAWIPGPEGHHDDNDPYVPKFQQASTTTQKGGQ